MRSTWAFVPKRSKQAATQLRESALRSGSKVSVAVETGPPNPTRYVIERTAPHAPVVRDELGTPRPELSPQRLLAPHVYGQKEIFGIAQEDQARLDLLDNFATGELRDAVERERQLMQRCSENGRLILDTLRRIDDAEAKLAELPNLEEWRKRFREAGFEELLRERNSSCCASADSSTTRSVRSTMPSRPCGGADG